jgi:hypothetical protein
MIVFILLLHSQWTPPLAQLLHQIRILSWLSFFGCMVCLGLLAFPYINSCWDTLNPLKTLLWLWLLKHILHDYNFIFFLIFFFPLLFGSGETCSSAMVKVSYCKTQMRGFKSLEWLPHRKILKGRTISKSPLSGSHLSGTSIGKWTLFFH